MKPDIAFKILKDCLTSDAEFCEQFKNLEFHSVNSKFPRSVVAFYENDKAGGEVTVYLIPDSSYCEYELFIAENETFSSEHKEFYSEEELADIISKYIRVIVKKCA